MSSPTGMVVITEERIEKLTAVKLAAWELCRALESCNGEAGAEEVRLHHCELLDALLKEL